MTWRNRAPVPAYKPLPKARILFTKTLRMLWADKRLFGGIALTQGVLSLLLISGFASSSNLMQVKANLDSILSGFGGKLAGSVVAFTSLLSKSGGGNTAVSGVYQGIILIIGSLAVIWALRQVVAKRSVRVRDSYYQGMYPLVPFLLVALLLGLQLLPMTLGSSLYSAVAGYGIAVHAWEQLVSLGIFAALSVWSLRMATGSIFALYIVTLPGMSPLEAYRSARQLVYGRRLLIWRKLIFLPIVLLLIAAVIEVPFILLFTPAAVWVFLVLLMAALPITHGYLYNLYREML